MIGDVDLHVEERLGHVDVSNLEVDMWRCVRDDLVEERLSHVDVSSLEVGAHRCTRVREELLDVLGDLVDIERVRSHVPGPRDPRDRRRQGWGTAFSQCSAEVPDVRQPKADCKACEHLAGLQLCPPHRRRGVHCRCTRGGRQQPCSKPPLVGLRDGAVPQLAERLGNPKPTHGGRHESRCQPQDPMA